MAYSTAKVSLMCSTIEGQGPQLWSVINSDSIATMMGAGYISDATKIGMRVGDLVFLSSGTFNTAVYPSSGASTAAVGEGADFTDTPPVRAVMQVGSIASGAATLTENLQIGAAATAKVGFHGATPIVQPAVLAAITTTQPTATVFGFTTTAQFNNLIAAVNQLIANQKSYGLMATA